MTFIKSLANEHIDERDKTWVYDTITYSDISVIVEVPRKQKEIKYRQSFADDDCRGVMYVIDMPIPSKTEPIKIDSISILNIIDGALCGTFGPFETDSLIAEYDKEECKTAIWKRNGRFHRLDYYYGLRVYCENFKSLEQLNEYMDKIVVFRKEERDKL